MITNTATYVDEDEPVEGLAEVAKVTAEGELVSLTVGVPGGPKRHMVLDIDGAKTLGTQLIRAATKIEGTTEQIAILVMPKSQLARLLVREDDDEDEKDQPS